MSEAPDITTLLRIVVEKGASDLHLSVGRPPTLRLHGSLHALPFPELEPQDTVALVQSVAPKRAIEELNKGGGADFAYPFGDVARFRTSIFRQKSVVGMAMRLIPNQLLTFEEIGLPTIVKDLCRRPRGLVLVTGPTGSGKTTTLATMVDYINTSFDRHIVTIEDPIEYFHGHKKSIVTQRELGVDVGSFPEALRRALRQDPNVILVGEMRDLDTIHAAITAAETGHLVFATLHTTGSARTVDRIIDAFPKDQQEQIRVQLSVSIIAVISQVLVPRTDGEGRVAAFEIMIMNPAIENLIRENKTFRIDSTIQTSRREGMVLLDDSLFDLFLQRKVSGQAILEKAVRPEDLVGKIREREAGIAAAAPAGGAGAALKKR
ncbi:MAG: type IV pilus twitching motility protein PilT [Planctomycetales bacterium]|nr:type IV pilus twitching motility protein PilT [Planctomycetales bacterium]